MALKQYQLYREGKTSNGKKGIKRKVISNQDGTDIKISGKEKASR